MGMKYVASFTAVAVTAAQDFFELDFPADCVGVIHEIHVTQSTEAGDAAAEMLRGQIKRASGTTTGGSGGSTMTPAPLEFGFAAAGTGTVEINNTTQHAVGTGVLTTILEECFNVAIGWHYVPTPESRPVFSPSQTCVIALAAAPADSVTMSGYVVFEEIGG